MQIVKIDLKKRNNVNVINIYVIDSQLPYDDNSISGTEATYVSVSSVNLQQLAEKDATHTSSKAW